MQTGPIWGILNHDDDTARLMARRRPTGRLGKEDRARGPVLRAANERPKGARLGKEEWAHPFFRRDWIDDGGFWMGHGI